MVFVACGEGRFKILLSSPSFLFFFFFLLISFLFLSPPSFHLFLFPTFSSTSLCFLCPSPSSTSCSLTRLFLPSPFSYFPTFSKSHSLFNPLYSIPILLSNPLFFFSYYFYSFPLPKFILFLPIFFLSFFKSKTLKNLKRH